MDDALAASLPSVLRLEAGYLRLADTLTDRYSLHEAILVAELVDDILFCLSRDSSSLGTEALAEPHGGDSLGLKIPVRFLRLPTTCVLSFTEDLPSDVDPGTVMRFSDMGLWPDPDALPMVIPDPEICGELASELVGYNRRPRGLFSDSAFVTGDEGAALVDGDDFDAAFDAPLPIATARGRGRGRGAGGARSASPRVAKLSVPGLQAEFQTALAAERVDRQAFEVKVLDMLGAIQLPPAGRGKGGVTSGEGVNPSLQWPPRHSQGIMGNMQAMAGSAPTGGPASGGPGLIHGTFPADVSDTSWQARRPPPPGGTRPQTFGVPFRGHAAPESFTHGVGPLPGPLGAPPPRRPSLVGSATGRSPAVRPSVSFAADGLTAPPSVGTSSNPDVAALVGAVAQLTALAAQNVSAPTGGVNVDAALDSLLGSGDGSSKVAGARGAAHQELLRREYEVYPSRISAAVRARVRQRRTVGLHHQEEVSMYGFMANEVPFGQAKTAAYQTFGMATVFDQMERGEWELAEATLALLLCSTEMAALKSWRWDAAWLLTHQPQPPFNSIARAPPTDALHAMPKLAPPLWIASVGAYVNDVLRIDEGLKRVAPKQLPAKKKGGGKGEAPEGE